MHEVLAEVETKIEVAQEVVVIPAVSITNLVAEIPPTTRVHVPVARVAPVFTVNKGPVTAAANVTAAERAVEPQVPDTGAPTGTFVRVAATCALIVTVVVEA